MAYSELIKDISRIRDYLREFFVFGFRSRGEIGRKSPRSYDNEKRRVESWLGEYMSFRQDAAGKNVFISVDARHVPRNPLYNAWKASSFTDNDITLHFWLMDILTPEIARSLSEIIRTFDSEYLPFFSDPATIDESTLRKKLKEYIGLGLVQVQKQGRQLAYRLSEDETDVGSWQHAIEFFAEASPMGVIGSYLQDKFASLSKLFLFKHNYLLFAPDSGIMLELLSAINEKRNVEIEFCANRKQACIKLTVLPLKIYVSTQGGRQYSAACDTHAGKIMFFRLDTIQKVKASGVAPDYGSYSAMYEDFKKHLWGVALGDINHTSHLEMVLKIEADENFIVARLEREKRGGAVERVDDTLWKFSADVYDPQEMIPWIRTFTGRIVSLECSNEEITERFKADLSEMALLYGGGDGAV